MLIASGSTFLTLVDVHTFAWTRKPWCVHNLLLTKSGIAYLPIQPTVEPTNIIMPLRFGKNQVLSTVSFLESLFKPLSVRFNGWQLESSLVLRMRNIVNFTNRYWSVRTGLRTRPRLRTKSGNPMNAMGAMLSILSWTSVLRALRALSLADRRIFDVRLLHFLVDGVPQGIWIPRGKKQWLFFTENVNLIARQQ